MSQDFASTAQHFFASVSERYAWPAAVPEGAAQQLAELLEQTARAERDACAAIADQVMGAYGSHAAEQVAARIRARSGA